jgi:hypothetical protein
MYARRSRLERFAPSVLLVLAAGIACESQRLRPPDGLAGSGYGGAREGEAARSGTPASGVLADGATRGATAGPAATTPPPASPPAGAPRFVTTALVGASGDRSSAAPESARPCKAMKIAAPAGMRAKPPTFAAPVTASAAPVRSSARRVCASACWMIRRIAASAGTPAVHQKNASEEGAGSCVLSAKDSSFAPLIRNAGAEIAPRARAAPPGLCRAS